GSIQHSSRVSGAECLTCGIQRLLTETFLSPISPLHSPLTRLTPAFRTIPTITRLCEVDDAARIILRAMLNGHRPTEWWLPLVMVALFKMRNRETTQFRKVCALYVVDHQRHITRLR